MTTWHADSTRALEEIGALIHDAWFDIDDVRHDQEQHALIVPFAQQWDEDDAPTPELIKRTWRYREERVPLMRGTLRIEAVVSVEVDRDAGDAGMLVGLRYDERERKVTMEGISGDLHARVERLEVTAELVKEVAMYVRRRQGLLGESEEPWSP